MVVCVARAIVVSAIAAFATGCTTETKPRLLPFAQSRYEIMVGDSFDVTVALTKPADKTAYVDISSTAKVCRSDPSEVRFDPGDRVRVSRITGIDSSRGLYRRVTFALRGTDTSNSLLVLVMRQVPSNDGGTDGAGDAPRPNDGRGDAPSESSPGDARPDGDSAAADSAATDSAAADAGGSGG